MCSAQDPMAMARPVHQPQLPTVNAHLTVRSDKKKRIRNLFDYSGDEGTQFTSGTDNEYSASFRISKKPIPSDCDRTPFSSPFSISSFKPAHAEKCTHVRLLPLLSCRGAKLCTTARARGCHGTNSLQVQRCGYFLCPPELWARKRRPRYDFHSVRSTLEADARGDTFFRRAEVNENPTSLFVDLACFPLLLLPKKKGASVLELQAAEPGGN